MLLEVTQIDFNVLQPHRSSTFRSLVNFVSSPFKRSPVQSKRGEGQQRQIEAARPEEDVASESGSEDNWQGEPPADVFSLAAATRASESQQQMEEDTEVHVRLDAPPQQVPQQQSARSMLSKFLQAKAGAPMTPEDMRSFELLTERVAAEDGARSLANYGTQAAPAPFVFGTRGERAESTAFSFSSVSPVLRRHIHNTHSHRSLISSLLLNLCNDHKPLPTFSLRRHRKHQQTADPSISAQACPRAAGPSHLRRGCLRLPYFPARKGKRTKKTRRWRRSEGLMNLLLLSRRRVLS